VELNRELPEIGEFEEVISFLSERMEKIKHFCEQENIEFYDLRIPLKERASAGKLYYPNDFHINPLGNSVVANYLIEKLLKAPKAASIDAVTK